MDNNVMNVAFSSDDNYAQHMGVAIYSLLKNNRDFHLINIYIIDNLITEHNKKKITELVGKFGNAKIIWVDFETWKSRLNLNMKNWKISISAYARLFLGSILDESVGRILYLDCDVLIQESLKKLWNMDLTGYVLAAVQDTVRSSTKQEIDMDPEMEYFNSGMLLIDVMAWRTNRIEEQCMNFINKKKGCVLHHDQGVLNGVLNGNFRRLPIQYNIMTIHYMWKRDDILNFFGEKAQYYTEDEIKQALEMPVILHFTPSFTSRPWCRDCKHPLKKYYWEYIKYTPWSDAIPQKSKDKWYVKLIAWRYRNFPI